MIEPTPEILVRLGERVLQRVRVGASPVHVGRAHTNAVVLSDARVSSHHAVFWWDGHSVWVEDMGSRNGTWVGDVRIGEARLLLDHDTVRLGGDVVLEVTVPKPGAARPAPKLPCLEDVDGGMKFPLWSDRFHIGAGSDADLRLDAGPARAATLIVFDDEVWLGGEDGADQLLEPGVPFELAGRRFQLSHMDAGRGPTTGMDVDRYPYRITATLNGASGPEAQVEHLHLRPRYRVEADMRAILLYLLARRLSEDRVERVPGEEQGWCADTDVARDIWGRGKSAQDANSLNVLVHRVRKELVGAGFEPWFIEKRKRRIRVRVTEVQVA